MKTEPIQPDKAKALAEKKRLLLEKRLNRTVKKGLAARAALPKRPEGSRRLASLGQARIWILANSGEISSGYNITSSFLISSTIDHHALEYSLNHVVARHETLRSTYHLEDGEIVQQLHQDTHLKVATVACSSESAMYDQAEQFGRIPFDTEQGPLLQLGLFSCQQDQHILILSIHDIIFDKWSLKLFWSEFSAFYREKTKKINADVPELDVQYVDFSHWQRDWLKQGEQDKQFAYWQEKLKNPPPPLPLPTDFPYPNELSDAGRLERSRLSVQTSLGLKTLAAENDASLFTLLLLGFSILLSRYADTQDVLISSPVANRRWPETSALIGFFLNTLVIRPELKGNPSVIEALLAMRTSVLEALNNQDLPTNLMAEAAQAERVEGRHPLFQTMFIFQREDEGSPKLALDDCTIAPIYIETGTSKFDLSLFVAESGQGLETIVEYRTDIFSQTTMARFLEHYALLMKAIVANPTQSISNLEFLTENEINFCREAEAGPLLALSDQETILDLLTRHQDSKRLAVCTGQSDYTYMQVQELSSRLAFELIKRGARANQPIALLMERCALSIISLLGILKAGAPYVAIDIDYPEDRIHFILDDATINIVVVSHTGLEQLGRKGLETIVVEELIGSATLSEEQAEREKFQLPSINPKDIAYLIYTSGSSGNPKAVAVTHRNLLASTQARLDYYGAEALNFLLIPSLTFDSSVAGIFWTLVTTGTLVVATLEELQDPDKLCQLVEDKKVQAILAVPSLYEQLLNWEPRRLQNLKVAIVAGEACAPKLLAQHHAMLPDCTLYNEYGPTEATVWASVQRCDKEQLFAEGVPIGYPIPGSEIRILDQQKNRTPVGFTGELCIAGLGVTPGYPNNQALTENKFFTSPDGTKFYATGDLARWRQDGALQYLGRNDDQVKVRGYRVELSEIEQCLKTIPGIKDAAVIANSTIQPQKSLSLDELLGVLPDEIITKALAEIEAELDGSIDVVASGKTLQRDGFELTVNFKDTNFIQPPRKAQRDWLISQSMHEIAEDLEYLDKIASGFVAGKDHQLGSDLIDIEQANLSHDEIMEDWQDPIMRKMAEFATQSHGDVLEIGFGRGVSASFIQNNKVNSHTIIEMNGPCIENYFKPWRKGYPDSDIVIHQARWQDCHARLGQYDGILFHAYPMNESEFVDYILKSVTFAEHAFADMASHLKEGGVFTYMTTEIDSISRRHQRALFKHFSQLSIEVVPIEVPEDTIDSWWTDSMVAIKAVK